jgi:hypothetical protein
MRDTRFCRTISKSWVVMYRVEAACGGGGAREFEGGREAAAARLLPAWARVDMEEASAIVRAVMGSWQAAWKGITGHPGVHLAGTNTHLRGSSRPGAAAVSQIN